MGINTNSNVVFQTYQNRSRVHFEEFLPTQMTTKLSGI